MQLPVIHYSGIPWVRLVLPSPLAFAFFANFWLVDFSQNFSIGDSPIHFLVEPGLPPGGSGLSINSDPKDWAEFNQTSRCNFLGYPKFNQNFVIPLGYEPFTGDVLFPNTQILTVYAYPNELNYDLIREKKDWFNLKVFNRVSNEKVELEKLVFAEFLSDTLDGRFSEKFIYVSMGSITSVDLVLIKRLVQVLGETNHKYIFSKGPRHSEYALARNMYGDRYLPQTAIIPHVDLMISHGSNNTVTETFAEGKPLIILPMFADQFDNAQRLQEAGLGARLDPYTFTDRELIDTIDKFLNDQELVQKMRNSAKRIQALNRHEELVKKIEGLIV